MRVRFLHAGPRITDLFVDLWKCKHCQKEFSFETTARKANHSKWCNLNPKRAYYVRLLEQARGSKVNFRNQYSKADHEGTEKPSNSRKGKTGFRGTPHTEETKAILRKKALASKHRRILRSTRKYAMKDGSEVLLDSSWEEALAIRLDSLDIRWTRPESVEWIDDEGKSHNYFPDFYLVDYDVYLDPKNDQVYKISLSKIEKITKVLPNLRILRSLTECKNFSI